MHILLSHHVGRHAIVLFNEAQAIVHKIMCIGVSASTKVTVTVKDENNRVVGEKDCNYIRGADYQHEVDVLESIRNEPTSYAVRLRGEFVVIYIIYVNMHNLLLNVCHLSVCT